MNKLVLTDEEVKRIRRQMDEFPWYRKIFDTYQTRVDELLRRRPKIPVEKGRAFYESCPEDNARLAFDPYNQKDHRCPKCGKQWSGDKYDSAWVRQFQEWLAKRLVEAGIIYRLTGESRYAEYAGEVLGHFIAHYKEYPLANNLLGPTRLFQSTYLEAFWLTDMVVAYDLVNGHSGFSFKFHEEVKQLFYDSCDVIASFDEKISNRQAFNNVAMGAVGFLYDDKQLIDRVLNGSSGFFFHMQASLLEDGLWYEGENYHFATLHHLLNLAEVAFHCHVDLYDELRPMFYGPLKVMYPNLAFPARKDGWYGRGVDYYREVYELGFSRYQDDKLGGLLAHAYGSGDTRSDLEWRGFLYCTPELPEMPLRALRPHQSESMPGSGVAVLRSGQGETYLSTEYGHYGGGHGHPDRLAISFFDSGCLWFTDPGTGWYHVPELSWYRSTLAHNTVTVDQKSQTPQEGSLEVFADTNSFQVVQARVNEVYPGVEMRRTLCLNQAYLLDVFDIYSEQEHTYDWVVHSLTKPEVSGAESASADLGYRDGYEYLRNVCSYGEKDQLEVSLRNDKATLRLVQLGTSAYYTAETLGIPLKEEQPFHTILARRKGTSTRFATCFFKGSGQSEAQITSCSENMYEIAVGAEKHLWRVDPLSRGLSVLTQTKDATVALHWFGCAKASTSALSVVGDRTLEQASITVQEDTLTVNLPGDFGHITLSGSALDPVARVSGLPAGATYQTKPGGITLIQANPVSLWPDNTKPTAYLGCTNTVSLHMTSYQDRKITPEVDLPTGWRLISCAPDHFDLTKWNVAFTVPSTVAGLTAEIKFSAGGSQVLLPLEIKPPLAVEWFVRSANGVPTLELEACDMRKQGGTLHGKLIVPWSLDPTPFTVQIPVGNLAGKYALPLPSMDVPPRQSQCLDGEPAGRYELAKRQAPSGEYQVVALLNLENFSAMSRIDLPLYWANPVGSGVCRRIRLDRPAQAYWAEVPYQNTVDCSAWATLNWDDQGLHLLCDVQDDFHCTDGNDDDLYENDSVQVYFDFRKTKGSPFSPGVAAYVLAPSEDKQNCIIRPIAGNREISNRKARADWFSSDGVLAEIEPKKTGYVIKAFFPYPSLGVAPVQQGDVIGFDLSVSDNDSTWYRKFQLVWSGARGRRCYIRGSYHNPLEYGHVVISANGKEL